MGIKNLNTIIKRYAPNSFGKVISLSEYLGKRVAVDASVYMYKYKSVYGTRWISAFYNFIRALDGINCVFVFDSKTCIDEKVAERAKRSDQKKQLRERVELVEAALTEYRETGKVTDILRGFVPTNTNYTRLISSSPSSSREYSTFSVEKAEEYISRSKNHLLPIYPDDFETVKQICRATGIATLDATMEAEKLCAMLCLENKVDAVMTEDTDALAYCARVNVSNGARSEASGAFGATTGPIILCKVNLGKCTEIRIQQVLSELAMSREKFIDMCILCGTDYSPSVQGIGPMRAYKFITTYNTIEAIENSLKYNVASINYKRLREIFSQEPSGIESIVYPSKNEPSLQMLLAQNNIFKR
jgi:5'-3' exonuclease